MSDQKIIGFAHELVALVKNGTKTLTYRLGDKYDFLKPGDVIKTKDSSTGEVFGKLTITEKSVCEFKDLVLDLPGHEAYGNLEDARQSFEKLYSRPVKDDERVVILNFEFKTL